MPKPRIMTPRRIDWENKIIKKLKAPDEGLVGIPVFGKNDPIEDWRALIEPGDNWLSIYWPTGRIYGKIYPFYFTHAAQCTSSKSLIEALSGGVSMTDNERYQGSTIAVTRWKGITKEQQAFIADQARTFIGMPYDWSELSWFIARGGFYLGAIPALLFGHIGLALGLRILARVMNKRNLLDRRQAVICSKVLAEDARRANGAGLKPLLPVDKLGAGQGCLAPAHFANPHYLDWVLIKSGENVPE